MDGAGVHPAFFLKSLYGVRRFSAALDQAIMVLQYLINHRIEFARMGVP